MAALQGEAERLAGVGEQLVDHGGDGRAAARRDDRAPAELGDADPWSRWGAVEGEGCDHLLRAAQSLDGDVVGDLAGRQADGGVEVARRLERSDPDAPAQDAAKLVDLLACTVHLGQDPPGARARAPQALAAVAGRARGAIGAVARVYAPSGGWLVIRASILRGAGDIRTALTIEPARAGDLAPSPSACASRRGRSRTIKRRSSRSSA